MLRHPGLALDLLVAIGTAACAAYGPGGDPALSVSGATFTQLALASSMP